MIIRFLGTHNAESKSTRLSSFLIDGELAVDAGSLVSELSFPEQEKIKAVLLTHGHYDHIKGLPAFAFNNSQHLTRVLGIPHTLDILSSHLMDGVIYPKFHDKTPFLKRPSLALVPITPFSPENLEEYRVLAVPVNHQIPAVGFEITSEDGKRVFYTGDTGPGLSAVWERVSPQLLITEVTWPDGWEKAARETGHLCPAMLESELSDFHKIRGYFPRVILTHLSPKFEEEIRKEVDAVSKKLGLPISIAREGDRLTV